MLRRAWARDELKADLERTVDTYPLSHLIPVAGSRKVPSPWGRSERQCPEYLREEE